MVKTHPRDTSGAFERAGLTVDQNSAVPWEVIQLCCDFQDHVFLTVSSGSVLSINLACDDPVSTWFLYKMCNLSENPLIENVTGEIESVLTDLKDCADNIRIAERIEDFSG